MILYGNSKLTCFHKEMLLSQVVDGLMKSHIWAMPLTHWGQVTNMCVGKPTIIGSDNGLSPEQRQSIIWANAWILLISRPLGTNFTEILIGNQTFSFKKLRSKLSCEIVSISPWPQCVNQWWMSSLRHHLCLRFWIKWLLANEIFRNIVGIQALLITREWIFEYEVGNHISHTLKPQNNHYIWITVVPTIYCRV